MLGRGFLSDEDTPGAAPVAMISSELWQRRFGRDALLAGAKTTLNSTSYIIIGVLPAGFQFPFPGLDVWVTRPTELSAVPPPSRPLSQILTPFARLKPGVALEQANAELSVLSQRYGKAHPGLVDAKPGAPMRAQGMRDQLVVNVRSMLWMLFGALALTRVMKTLLFQVSPTDPAAFAVIGTIFVLIALAASYIPARQATRIDPMTALRG